MVLEKNKFYFSLPAQYINLLFRMFLVFIFVFFSCIHPLNAEENNLEQTEEEYAFCVLKEILKDSPEGHILCNNVRSMEIAFLQQERNYMPSVQLDFSANSNVVQGDINYIKNRGVISGQQLLLSPSVNIGITQNLPGSGRLSFGAGYGLSYLAGENGFRQQPYLQAALTQTLARGAFFLSRDPSLEMLQNQKALADMEYKKAVFEILRQFVETVQNYNVSLLEKEYYSVMLKKIESEYAEQNKRFGLGQKSEADLFNLHMKQSEMTQKFKQSALAAIQAESVLKTYMQKDIIEKSTLFRSGMLSLLSRTYGGSSLQTIEEYRILNELEAEALSLKINEARFLPIFYMQLSVSPNQGKNSQYTDLSRSLRDLTEGSESWSFNASAGLRLSLDYVLNFKLIEENSRNKTENLELQLQVLKDEQEQLRILYDEWASSFYEYCNYLEQALIKEEDYRKDLKTLLERKIITEAEYWTSEAEYFETRLNYCRSVWNMIQGKMNVLCLSDSWIDFVQQFLDEYAKAC